MRTAPGRLFWCRRKIIHVIHSTGHSPYRMTHVALANSARPNAAPLASASGQTGRLSHRQKRYPAVTPSAVAPRSGVINWAWARMLGEKHQRTSDHAPANSPYRSAAQR